MTCPYPAVRRETQNAPTPATGNPFNLQQDHQNQPPRNATLQYSQGIEYKHLMHSLKGRWKPRPRWPAGDPDVAILKP